MAHDIVDLKPQLRIELPGIPEPVLADALSDAVDDFLSDSEVWKYTVPGLLDWEIAQPFPTIAHGTEIPANTRVARIDTVKFGQGGTDLKTVPFMTRQQLDTQYSDWEVRTGSSPQVWTNDGPNNPVITPIATEDQLGSLKLRVILASDGPALSSLPEFILHEFGDAIRYATLARLMKIPGKDWTNFKAAAGYQNLYDAAVTDAKSRSEAEFGQPTTRTMSYGGIDAGLDNQGYDDYGQR